MNEPNQPPAPPAERPRVSLKTRIDGLRATYRANTVKPAAIYLPNEGEFDALCDIMESPLPPEGERAFIVTSCYGWGKDASLMGAKRKCRQQSPRGKGRDLVFRAQLVHKDTECDGSGGISYLPEFPPLSLGEV
jgi:hypothetical protein